MSKRFCGVIAGFTLLSSAPAAIAATNYLNDPLIDVSIGSGPSPGSFNNTFSNGQTIDKVIDAPSADAEEFHDQTTHIWFTADEAGGGLELLFDFSREYEISALHFWNYTSESFDVDNIDFIFSTATPRRSEACPPHRNWEPRPA